jgi:hypothetical protein
MVYMKNGDRVEFFGYALTLLETPYVYKENRFCAKAADGTGHEVMVLWNKNSDNEESVNGESPTINLGYPSEVYPIQK